MDILTNTNGEVIFLLGPNEAESNAVAPGGVTMLHYAVSVQDRVMVERLLTNGAHVNAQDAYGDTPLHYLARLSFDYNNILSLLSNAGADFTILNSHAKTPNALALDHGNKFLAYKLTESYLARELSCLETVLNKRDMENIQESAVLGSALRTSELYSPAFNAQRTDCTDHIKNIDRDKCRKHTIII